jgi:hypothetical protein
MTDATWQFNDPPNVAVIVNRKIVLEGDWIAYVSHDLDDGCWQFHTSQPEPVREEDAMLVSLKNIVDRDPSINALSELPLGWHAWRDSQDSEWQTSVKDA